MITFVGSIIPDADLEWFRKLSKAPLPISSDTHQKSIIKGIRAYETVDVLYLAPSGFFPTRFKQPVVMGKEYDTHLKRLKSSNIPLFRIRTNIDSQVKGIENSIKAGSSLVVIYMPFYQRMQVIKIIKKRYPRIPIVTVIPDLIEHSYSKKGVGIRRSIVKSLRYLESKEVTRLSRYIDGFIYLTENMKNRIGNGQEYIVQEAIYDLDSDSNDDSGDLLNSVLFHEDEFVFTYCGKIDKTNGIDRLIRAFMEINNKNAVLCLCGSGDMMKFAKEKSKVDDRIKVLGAISHNDVKRIEKMSDVLVNPRYTAIENAAYSFPSKLIEYLACGKPVISSKLSGIPNDYSDYVFYIKDDSSDALKNEMEKLINIGDKELKKIGDNNRKFVLDCKSSKAQGEKMVILFNHLRQGDQ